MTESSRIDVFTKLVKRANTLHILLILYQKLFPQAEVDYACQLIDEAHTALKNHLNELTNGDN